MIMKTDFDAPPYSIVGQMRKYLLMNTIYSDNNLASLRIMVVVYIGVMIQQHWYLQTPYTFIHLLLDI